MREVFQILAIVIGGGLFISCLMMQVARMLDHYYKGESEKKTMALPPCGRIHLGPALVWGAGVGEMPDHLFYQCLSCQKFMSKPEADTYINITTRKNEIMRNALQGAKAK